MKRHYIKSKSGAASFYVVAFSALILTIVAVGFAAVIISEIERASNDDLSQSAYDSALAGIEDAKLAFYNYQSCIDNSTSVIHPTTPDGDNNITCSEIVYWMENPDCDMVAHILGRIGETEEGEVLVKEQSESGSNMQQAYTCVKVKTSLTDYRGTLTSDNATRVVRVKLDGVSASAIEKVKVSWYSDDGLTDLRFANFNGGVTFRPLNDAIAVPPTIAVQLIQTAQSFTMEQFDETSSGATNRGSVILVPTNDTTRARQSLADNYIGAYDGTSNNISPSQFVKSNDKTVKNLPYAVYCNKDLGTEFVCTTWLNLPNPIGGARSDETFTFVLSTPYQQPSTDFSLEFYCADGVKCGEDSETIETEGYESLARVDGVQINIDSTGRANDLYRRVEARLESNDINFPYPLYALELLDSDKDASSLLNKNITSTKEWNF